MPVLLLAIAASLDGDLHLSVGPAAVISEISGQFAGAVIDNDLEGVLARRGKTGGHGAPAIHELDLRRMEGDLTGSAILDPTGRHANRFAVARGQAIIGGRNRQ